MLIVIELTSNDSVKPNAITPSDANVSRQSFLLQGFDLHHSREIVVNR